MKTALHVLWQFVRSEEVGALAKRPRTRISSRICISLGLQHGLILLRDKKLDKVDKYNAMPKLLRQGDSPSNARTIGA